MPGLSLIPPQMAEGVGPLAGEAGVVQAGADVLGHGLAGQVRHAHADGGDHRDVVVLHAGEPGVGLVALLAHEFDHGGLVHGQFGQDVLVALDQIGVAAGADQELVEGQIRLPHAADVPALHAAFEGLGQERQLPHGGIAGGGGAEIGGLALDGVAHVVEVDHVHHVQIQHEAAALPRAADHEADLRQAGHSLRHGGAADAQGGGQLVHVQLGAGQDAQCDDLVIEQLHHQIPELGPGLGLHIAFEFVFVHADTSMPGECSYRYYTPGGGGCQRKQAEGEPRGGSRRRKTRGLLAIPRGIVYNALCTRREPEAGTFASAAGGGRSEQKGVAAVEILRANSSKGFRAPQQGSTGGPPARQVHINADLPRGSSHTWRVTEAVITGRS